MYTISKQLYGLALLLFASLFFSCTKEIPTMESPLEQSSEITPKDLSLRLSVPQTEVRVSFDDALAATQHQRQNTLRTLREKSVLSSITLNTSTGEPALYIINYEPEGYAIVSASRKYTPILAYSDTGSMSYDNETNPITKSLLEGYIKQIEHANELPDSLVRGARLQWEMLGENRPSELRTISYDENIHKKIARTIEKYEKEGYKVYRYGSLFGNYDYDPSRESNYYNDEYIFSSAIRKDIDHSIMTSASSLYNVENYVLILLKEHREEAQKDPLIQTTWGQGYYPKNAHELNSYLQRDQYNMYVQHYHPLGCVTLAVGQIIRYHQYPNIFDWSNMPNNYPTKKTADFLFRVAIELNTEFSETGATSNIKNAKKLFNSLRYKTTLINHDTEEYMTKIYKSLNTNKPVYARGAEKSKKDGHAFIIDGYKNQHSRFEIQVLALPDAPEEYIKSEEFGCIYETNSFENISNMFHLNLGWDGIDNGFYFFDKFNDFNKDRKYLIVTPQKKLFFL